MYNDVPFVLITRQSSHFRSVDTEARVRFPTLPEKKVVGLERGPLCLVSTTEELLDRKRSGSCLEN
jgi:hypothetical protein